MESGASWVSESFQQLDQGVNGLGKSSFHELRKRAFESFRKLGLPTPQLEDWKYTNIRDLNSLGLTVSQSGKPRNVSREDLSRFLIPQLDCYCLVVVDGIFQPSLSSQNLPTGLSVASIRSIAKGERPDLAPAFQAYFASQFVLESDSIVSLNTAFVQDGCFVAVSPKVSVDKPLHILFVTSRSQEPQATYPRLLFLAEKNSKVALIESFCSLDERGAAGTSGLTSYVGEMFLEENASVEHVVLGQESVNQYHLGRHGVIQKRDSRLSTSSISFGGKVVRNELFPVLQGENTRTVMNGLTVLSGSQHVDNFTVLDHAVPNCESEELYKGVYGDSSQGVFCGTIIVREGAQKTNAIQNNQGLLLSNKSSLHTKPQLKIWADDVKCTHGATIGQLDQNALFYIRSRGVSETEAKKLLVKAFVSEASQAIEHQEIRDYVDMLIDRKLSELSTEK